jgi:uncharacterized membrane protein
MNELPEFWRTEIFHALSVHMPLALLITATGFKLVALWSSGEVWKKGGSVLLFFGVVGAWLSVYTGNLADVEVSRDLCDPTVLKDHENASLWAAWLFTAAVLFEGLGAFLKKKTLKIPIFALMLSASGILVYTGHLGARLVYQQAAGVHIPSDDCEEFE